MAQNVTWYNLLISCPGDVKEEVALIESAVEEFNELYVEPLGITKKLAIGVSVPMLNPEKSCRHY